MGNKGEKWVIIDRFSDSLPKTGKYFTADF